VAMLVVFGAPLLYLKLLIDIKLLSVCAAHNFQPKQYSETFHTGA